MLMDEYIIIYNNVYWLESEWLKIVSQALNQLDILSHDFGSFDFMSIYKAVCEKSQIYTWGNLMYLCLH